MFAALFALPATSGHAQAPACTITWVGDLNDDWFGANPGNTNWSGDRLPGNADFVCLNNLASPYTVRMPGQSANVAGFRIESNVTLVLEGPGSQAGLSGQTLDSTNAGTIRLTDISILSSANNVTNTTLTNTGTISVPAGGAAGGRTIAGNIINRGTISVAHPQAVLGLRRANSTIFFQFPIDTLVNEGTIAVASGGALKIFRSTLTEKSGSQITGPGQVNVTGANNQGTCSEVLGANSTNGAVSILHIDDGTIAPGADVNMQKCSQLELPPSAANVTGNIDVSPFVSQNNNTEGSQVPLIGDIPAGVSIDIDSLGPDAQTPRGFGGFFEGARLVIHGNVTNRGKVSLNGPGAWLMDEPDRAGDVMTNLGTIDVPSGGGAGPRVLGVVMDNQGAINVANPGTGVRAGLNTYEDAVVSGGANYEGSSQEGGQQVVLTNHGEVNVAGGAKLTVGWGAPDGDGGAFGSARPVTFVQDDGGSVEGGGAVTVFGNSSVLRFSGGTSETPFTVSRSADLEFVSEAGSTGHVDVSSEPSFGTLSKVSGNVPASVSIDVRSAVNQFGTMQSAVLVSAADWQNASTIRLVGNQTELRTTPPATLTNTGTVATAGAGSQAERLRFITGNIANQGLLDVTLNHFAILSQGTVSNGTGGQVNVAATAETGGSSLWTNAGTVTVAGRLATQGYTQTGGTTELVGGPPAEIASGQTMQVQGGVVKGKGTIGFDVNNTGGTISPGTSPGTLNVSGGYTQGPGGTFAVEVQGTAPGSGFDQLVVGRAASLNGTLTVDTSGFTPQGTDKFKILTSGFARTGTFSTVTQTGYRHGVTYNPRDVTLEQKPECSDGFDNDSDGNTDFPADGGCSSDTDNTEVTECQDTLDNDSDGASDYPADPGCRSIDDDSENTDSNPECSDELDNDSNGQIDYPNDGGCDSAQDDDESDPAPIYHPPADQLARQDARKEFNLGYFDDPGSGSPWQMTVDWGDGTSPSTFEWYPGYSATELHTYANQGEFTVTVTVAEGDASPDSDSGTFKITVREPKPECSDDEDNDFDGNVDFPSDPGCASADDNSERTESNPQCSDERDNDEDGQVDYPADSGCDSPSDPDEETNVATIHGPIITEGSSGTADAIFRITLSEPARAGASVEFSTFDYTAQAPSDYASRTTTVTFAAGDQSAEVRVPVNGDTNVEGNEQFYGYLYDPNRLTFDYGVAGYYDFATILDDDGQGNGRPVANRDLYVTGEDQTLSVDAPGVLANDGDLESDQLTAAQYTPYGGLNYGSLTLNADGSFTYVPNPGFTGVDYFYYQASDASGSSDPAIVYITVRTVDDDTPVANDDTATTDEDGSTDIDVLANDTGQGLSIGEISAPDHGTATVEGGKVRYTPDPDFNGSDSFTYRACDDANPPECSAPATVSVTVNEVNDAPDVADDTYETDEDEGLEVDAPGVLGNDADVEGDSLAAILVTGPAHGDLDLAPDGSFAYTPDGNFNGQDSFTYRADDGDETSGIATVTITVRAVNDEPSAAADDATTNEDTSTLINVLANDSDPDAGQTLAISSLSDPAHGTTEIEAGRVRYTPDADFNGSDSFTYRACDDANPPECSDPATVTVSVAPVNDTPTARADSAATDEDTSALVDVLANDSDPDSGQTLSISNLSAPSHGTATTENGKVRYTPAANYNGQDSFTYRACDNAGPPACSNPATVTITVRAVNDAPVANPDSATTDEDASKLVDVLANDTDVDSGPNLTISNLSDPANGTATAENGKVRYAPDPDFNGSDSFTYRACDNANPPACSAPATVTLTVNPVDEAPECSDTRDNDGDGRVDFPADQGCSSADDNSEAPDAPQCSDRLDNDSDGKTNFPADQGCDSAQDNSEAPDAPECSDRLDNDGDGRQNYPADQGCDSAQDNSEAPDPPECNDRLDNDADGRTNYPADQGCSSAQDNSEAPDAPQCSDRLDNDNDGKSNFPADQGCDSAQDNSEAPDPPQCSDRLDNDGDGKLNYPLDPGCDSAQDNSEAPDPPNPDGDGDGVPNTRDNCPTMPNPAQTDEDEDGLGDACDSSDNRDQCKVTDGGQITTRAGDPANFGANAHPGTPPKGEQTYRDHGKNGIEVKATELTDLRCSPNRKRATIKGLAKVNGLGSWEFRIDVTDAGEPGRGVDTYRIRVKDYDSGERVLDGGNIQIHK